MTNGRAFDKPSVYEILVDGTLDDFWADWFDGLSIVPQGEGCTVLTGSIADQAALHGMLGKIRDLGLPLLAVRRLDSDAED